MRRHVLAVVLVVAFGAGGLNAQQANVDQRLLFAPAPLGAGPAGFVRESSLQPQNNAVPAPQPRPSPANAAATPALRTTWPKGDLDRIGGAIGSPAGGLSLAQPQAFDLSRGVDLGGVSLGLETGRGNEGGGTKSLLSPEARDPPPSDPTIVKRGSPFLGLSLSAPTN